MPVHAKFSLGKKSWEYGQPIAPQPSSRSHSSHNLFSARRDPFAAQHNPVPSPLDPFSSHGFEHDFYDLSAAPAEMQAMAHAQREQLQVSPLGPHMCRMGILPPLYADSSSLASGSMPHSAPLDAAAEDIVEDTRRARVEGSRASSEHHDTKAEVGDQDATKVEAASVTSSSEFSLVNTSEAGGAPSPPPYTPKAQPVLATVENAQKVKKNTKTVFRRVIGLNLPFLFIGYKHKVTVTQY